MSLTDRLRRRTIAEKYIPGIDGLRFAAISSVLMLHLFIQNQHATVPYGTEELVHHRAYFYFMRMVWHGMRGVPIFFAISGFILALPFARHRFHNARPVSLSFYFLRRLTRLEPPYVAMLLIRLPFLILLSSHKALFYLKHFLASAVYLHNVIFGASSNINPPAWSLEIEIQFYCLVPLLAYYFAIRRPVLRKVLLLLVIGILGVIQVQYFNQEDRTGLSILFWLQYFLAGFLVADLYLTVWNRIPEHWLWELTLPLWAWVFLSDNYWFHAMMPFALVLLFVAAFKAPLQRRFFANAAISLIGGMCYSIYLTHNFVITGTGQLLRHFDVVLPVPLVWITFSAVCLACGTGFYLLIERPCMDPNWPRRLWRRFFPEAIATTDPAV